MDWRGLQRHKVLIWTLLGLLVLLQFLITKLCHKDNVVPAFNLPTFALDESSSDNASSPPDYMASRLQILQQNCLKTQPMNHLSLYMGNTSTIFVSEINNISVCTVPKSGCTFIRQILLYLDAKASAEHQKRLSDIFGTKEFKPKHLFIQPRQYIHGLFNLIQTANLTQFHRSSTLKVVFTRNPYSRLFSAYIDKIFVPMFWSYTKKRYLLKLAKHKRSYFRNSCRAIATTFEDFLLFVISDFENDNHANEHWMPATSICEPCRSQPDIIIKQETYMQDMQYLLQRMPLAEQDRILIHTKMGESSKHSKSTMQGLIWSMYEMPVNLNQGSRCLTRFLIAQRVWEALQIQGQISNWSSFPKDELRNINNYTTEQVVHVFMKHMKTIPITPEESKAQRHAALVNAYKNVSLRTLVKLQAIFYHDFVKYDYSFDVPT